MFDQWTIKGNHIERFGVSHKESRKLFRIHKQTMRDLIHNDIVFGKGRENGEEIHIT